MDAFVFLYYNVHFTLPKKVHLTLPKMVHAKLLITAGIFCGNNEQSNLVSLYWSSSLAVNDSAYCLRFAWGYYGNKVKAEIVMNDRWEGLPVRPVKNKYIAE